MTYEEFIDVIVRRVKSDERFKGLIVAPAQRGNIMGIGFKRPDTDETYGYDLHSIYDKVQRGEVNIDMVVCCLKEAVSSLFNRTHIPFNKMDYETVKKNMSFRPVPVKGNEDLLKRIQHIQFLDLALLICINEGVNENGVNTLALFPNSELARHGVTHERLVSDAMEVVPKNHPLSIMPMGKAFMRDLALGPEILDEFKEYGLSDDELIRSIENSPYFLATNAGRFMGASVIAYPGFAEKAYEMLGDDFYIVPSSVREVTLIPCRCEPDKADRDRMREALISTNTKENSPEDFLSDNLYIYRRSSGRIEIFEEPHDGFAEGIIGDYPHGIIF